MRGENKTGWNNEVVKRLTKQQLVESHPHVEKSIVEAKWHEVNGKEIKPKIVETEKE